MARPYLTGYTPKYPVQTLSKALDIIEYLKNNNTAEGVSISEISRELDMAKSGVHRLLDTLMAYGFVEKVENAATTYRLGWGLFDAGNAVPKQHTLNGANYTPLLERLCSTFNETVNLGVLNSREAVILCKMEPDIKIRTNAQVGEREPLYATAMGKLFLCDFTDKAIEEYFAAADTSSLAPNTITNAADMKEELKKVRRLGYAMDNEEFFEGMICCAMPVKDFTGKTVSGISVSGPAKRMEGIKLEEIRAELKKVCSEISAFLGYCGETV
ncbi:IclR family transcriptional regulator [Anaerotignum faecicola]|nr:IclR family transcriptional regulator [Anaerotignum faecicola]